jgi:serine/threonine protein kinase
MGKRSNSAWLGAGGIGEVYRARDSRLNRDVAIKSLLGEGAARTERCKRFEQDARVIAALESPNIVAVLDADNHGSGNACTMFASLARIRVTGWRQPPKTLMEDSSGRS